MDALVSERALREIYFPAFEAGVKEGGVWTVMSSYNRLNGPFASANHYLLTDVLKRGWGFNGMVMSDWGGAHPGTRVINAGNDLEMPGRGFLAPAKVKDALARGRTTPEQINQNVTRIVRTIVRSGVLNGPRTPNPALVNSPASRQVALQAAQEGIVLLKNERAMLPLNASKIRSIALIGPAAREMQIGAAGSPGVDRLRSGGPREGIRNRVGAAFRFATLRANRRAASFPPRCWGHQKRATETTAGPAFGPSISPTATFRARLPFSAPTRRSTFRARPRLWSTRTGARAGRRRFRRAKAARRRFSFAPMTAAACFSTTSPSSTTGRTVGRSLKAPPCLCKRATNTNCAPNTTSEAVARSSS